MGTSGSDQLEWYTLIINEVYSIEARLKLGSMKATILVCINFI